ncbi:MAG: hypothetical protein EOO24_38095 [Comamonadaceae bacterium]|nr:MAG: hypothetical protein EOO24_38095 [Comamonadaceae bacterium]
MQDSVYHVLLQGQRVGPYDRRTIVGMCIRKALGSDDVVVGADGHELTVRDLVRKPRADGDFQPNRSGSYSVVQGIYAAALDGVQGDACCAIPPYAGEMEVRVQTKVLRIEGRWREGLGWKQDRVKIPLEQVVHAAVRGDLVDLGLRARPGAAVQRLTLNLLSPEAAHEFAGLLPHVSAWPFDPVPKARAKPASVPGTLMVWGGAAGITVLVLIVVVAVWKLTHR